MWSTPRETGSCRNPLSLIHTFTMPDKQKSTHKVFFQLSFTTQHAHRLIQITGKTEQPLTLAGNSFYHGEPFYFVQRWTDQQNSNQWQLLWQYKKWKPKRMYMHAIKTLALWQYFLQDFHDFSLVVCESTNIAFENRISYKTQWFIKIKKRWDVLHDSINNPDKRWKIMNKYNEN